MTTQTDQLDQVMQAAERCEGMFDVTSVDFENMPVAAAKDLYVMADYLRRILPKGKRPVAVEWTGDTSVYFLALEFTDGSPVPGWWDLDLEDEPRLWSSFHEGPIESKLYRTKEDAALAMRWNMLDKLATSA